MDGMHFWLISEFHPPEKRTWRRGLAGSDRTAGAEPANPPNYYQILANLLAVQADGVGFSRRCVAAEVPRGQRLAAMPNARLQA